VVGRTSRYFVLAVFYLARLSLRVVGLCHNSDHPSAVFYQLQHGDRCRFVLLHDASFRLRVVVGAFRHTRGIVCLVGADAEPPRSASQKAVPRHGRLPTSVPTGVQEGLLPVGGALRPVRPLLVENFVGV